jgi:hypothetical protein
MGVVLMRRYSLFVGLGVMLALFIAGCQQPAASSNSGAKNVNDNDSSVTVPDVVGQSSADAEAAICSAGLSVGKKSTQPSTIVPSDRVIEQRPPGGERVSSGESVDLTISAGTPAPGSGEPDIDDSISIAGPTYPGQVGIGLAGIGGWSLEFVDAARTLRPFQALDGGAVSVDDEGWPTEDCETVLWDKRPVAAWLGEIDDPEHFTPNMAGTYSMSFTGRADVDETTSPAYIDNLVYDADADRTTCDLVVPDTVDEWSNLVILRFTNTDGGIRDLRVVRPGYAHEGALLFHQPFLDALDYASFSTLRFMDWTRSNEHRADYPARTEWADRASMTDATWTGALTGREPGAPWEMVIALANETGKDIWINIPVSASDDYIRQLALMLLDDLDSGIVLYVEYSNEVWNGLFPQSNWNQAYADEHSLTYITAYAKRTAEISQIFGEVFGTDAINNRVRVVNCWQIGWWPPDAQMNQQMEYINANFGPPADIIYALGVAPYYSPSSAAAGASVEQLLVAYAASTEASVAWRVLVKDLADRWSLPGGMVAYEGGPSMAIGDTTNVANKIRAHRDPRMGELIVHDLRENWFGEGGQLFMSFVLCSGYTRYGCWGLTDDITDPDRNHQFQAIRIVLGDM